MSRFTDPQHELFRAINSSVSYDRRLYPYDIAGSIAHARMLAACGVIPETDRDAILIGLSTVLAELDSDSFEFHVDDEDIHMAVERRLTEVAGDAGARLHTARSRNDQVATDLALFVREHSDRAIDYLSALMGTILDQAERHADAPVPGYTHLQRGQAVYLGHHLLAYFWMFDRDRKRFAAVKDSCSMLPLGAGALAGVNWATDRQMVAKELGFDSVSPNSIDAVANRDFALDYLAAAAACATHLSRLGAEIVLWSTQEFGFCEVSDGFASGSSLMPQKKNPDAAELLRAKAPRIVGHLAAFHGVMHGLPLTYNKDMQEDKEALFDSVDTLELCLRVADGMLGSIQFNTDAMAAAAADEFVAAVDIADLLVENGVPFREAHRIVGAYVKAAVDSDRKLSELAPDEMVEISPYLDDEVADLVRRGSWIETKISEGGTASPRLQDQITQARAAL